MVGGARKRGMGEVKGRGGKRKPPVTTPATQDPSHQYCRMDWGGGQDGRRRSETRKTIQAPGPTRDAPRGLHVDLRLGLRFALPLASDSSQFTSYGRDDDSARTAASVTLRQRIKRCLLSGVDDPPEGALLPRA